MGNNEEEKPSKPENAPSPPREQNGVHVYPDWSSVQAYYGAGAMPHPYYNPAVTSGHAAHPYMWAPSQMMPPYGSPYATMYPHAGMYAPSPAPVVATPMGLETPVKSTGNEDGQGNAASGNGKVDIAGEAGLCGMSQSTDCGSEGSDDKSDDSTAREDENSRNHRQMAKPNVNAITGVALCTSRPLGIGIQDERVLKREKRKQSNRESARRSRLRKQAEMEELAKQVDGLNAENMALRSELNKLVQDSDTLKSQNATLTEKLKHAEGHTGTTVTDR